MTSQEPNGRPPIRANDIWISTTMIGVILSVAAGVVSINETLTRGAVEQEARFIRLEETVKALKEQIIKLELTK